MYGTYAMHVISALVREIAACQKSRTISTVCGAQPAAALYDIALTNRCLRISGAECVCVLMGAICACHTASAYKVLLIIGVKCE